MVTWKYEFYFVISFNLSNNLSLKNNIHIFLPPHNILYIYLQHTTVCLSHTYVVDIQD